MASMKREYPDPGFRDPKRAKGDVSGFSVRKVRVALNPADCNLDFNVDHGGLHGYALHDNGFAYCWSGARANVGISRGRYCFGCKIISFQPVIMEDTPLDKQHITRIGISRGDDSVGNLGETEHSYGFGGTGKFSSSGIFSDYGRRYGLGDTIVCAIDLGNMAFASVVFSMNGEWLGAATKFNAGPGGLEVLSSPFIGRPWERAIFPHVLLKNVEVQMQFSIEDGLVPIKGYKPWACAMEDGNAVMGPTFSDPQDCEVITMVGLPAAGKTTWAEKWVKEHPEKRYICLGTNLALDHMKVPGLHRKNNYSKRFELLMDRATKIFSTLLSRAAKTPRNYILDQTNVYKSARKRKLKPFTFYFKIAVVIFPKPEDLTLRSRNRALEMGKEVPTEAVNKMIANFDLPRSKDMHAADEYFDEVVFPELNRDEAQRCLDEMKDCLEPPTISSRNAGSSLVQQNSAKSGSKIVQHSIAGSEPSLHSQHVQGKQPMSGYPMVHPEERYQYQNAPPEPTEHSVFEKHARPETLFGSHHRSINSTSGYSYPETNSSYGAETTLHRGYHGPLTPPYAEGRACSYRESPDQSNWKDGLGGNYIAGTDTQSTDIPRNTFHGGYMGSNGGSRPNFQQIPSPGSYGSRYGTPNAAPYGNFPRSTRPYGTHPWQRYI